jgi:hypothetical protein
LSLEAFAVLCAMHIAIVADLTNSKECPTSFDIAERKLNMLNRVLLKPLFVLFFYFSDLVFVLLAVLHVFYCTDSNLKLMFSSGVGYYFPVVDTLVEFYITEKVTEHV